MRSNLQVSLNDRLPEVAAKAQEILYETSPRMTGAAWLMRSILALDVLVPVWVDVILQRGYGIDVIEGLVRRNQRISLP